MPAPFSESPAVTAITSKLRPLLARLEQLPLCRRLHASLSSHRRGSRWLVAFVAGVLFMTILLSYMNVGGRIRSAGWLVALGIEHRQKACKLYCPIVRPNDPLWAPRLYPMEHRCANGPKIPIACSSEYKPSELLSQPPIPFLDNYRNPCWYEPFPPAETPLDELNPYRHNLYLCNSHVAKRLFKTASAQWAVRRKTERNPQRLRCLPYAYIAGMPKSGSTDLFRKLRAHPEVVPPPVKEPHWWGRQRFGARIRYTTSIPFRHYVDIYDNASLQIESRSGGFQGNVNRTTSKRGSSKTVSHHMITMDASVSTFWDNDEWWRMPENCGRTEPLFTSAHYIRRLTPQAKIIVILRSPTERLYSDYLFFTKEYKSLAAFNKFVNASINKLNACISHRSLRACAYDKRVASGKARVRLRIGLYHVYVAEWLKVFPRNQLLVLRTEDYSKNVTEAMRLVYKFLELRPLTAREEKLVVSMPIANARKAKDKKLGAMWTETRQLLRDFYRPHNQRLAEILQDDRFLWDDVTDAPTSTMSSSLPVDSTARLRPAAAAGDADGDGGDAGGSDASHHSDDDGGDGGGDDARVNSDVIHSKRGGGSSDVDARRTRSGVVETVTRTTDASNSVASRGGAAQERRPADAEDGDELEDEYDETDSRGEYKYEGLVGEDYDYDDYAEEDDDDDEEADGDAG